MSSNLMQTCVGDAGAIPQTITLDTTTHASGKQTANFNYNITIGPGTSQLLAVIVCGLGNGSDPGLTVKDGTTDMTLAVSGLDGTFGTFSSIYYLTGLSQGLHTINITVGTSTYCYSAAISLFGVKQTNPVDVSGIAFNNNATSINVPLTTLTNGTWIVSGFLDMNGNWETNVVSANQTIFYISPNNFFDGGIFGYMGPNTPAGLFSPDFHTNVTSTFGEMAAAAFIP